MFKNCVGMLLIGLLMFIVVIGFMLLVAYALNYLIVGGFIPCELLVYIETGLLLGIFMLVGYLLVLPTDNPIRKAFFGTNCKSD